MHLPESLQTIAEISIAFAGFSGLIVALRRNTGPLTELEKYRLQILLMLAFGAMFLALLPEVLVQLGTAETKIWRYTSLTLACYSVVFLLWWIYVSRRFAKATRRSFIGQRSRAWQWVTASFSYCCCSAYSRSSPFAAARCI